MSETTTDLRPEVAAFLAQVEQQLLDLPTAEREEVLSGLAADLDELVSEHGVEALGDPDRYSRELRAAAGLPEPPPPGGERLASRGAAGARAALVDGVDAVRGAWDRLLAALPGDAGGFLGALRPAWWVLRAGVAWMLAQDLRGPYVVVDVSWLLVLLVLLVGSVQLGRGGWGLGELVRRSVGVRLLVVGLNLLALALLPGAADRALWRAAEERAWQLAPAYAPAGDVDPDVLTWRGRQACELEVRDERGRPVAGASVVDLTNDRTLPMSSRRC